MKKNKKSNKIMAPAVIPAEKAVLADIRGLIESTRGRVASFVNAELTLLYWKIGQRIRKEILQEKRAEYGQEIVVTLSRQLEQDYGNGFGHRNLFRMIRLAECFPAEKIVSTLSTQLSWSHFLEIIQLDNALQRDFCAEMCRLERWSVRT
ncbi:MAG: DUF1016 N-terminal domain-containing protein, partial [Candidatus Margulisiibacteriota bacterium]